MDAGCSRLFLLVSTFSNQALHFRSHVVQVERLSTFRLHFPERESFEDPARMVDNLILDRLLYLVRQSDREVRQFLSYHLF